MTQLVDAHAFPARAQHEARRYGRDAWVFVRELVQNARDAGARRVWLDARRCDGRDLVSCRDDGDGLSFADARRYLFTLYASSKGRDTRLAGRFGVGFWSVLRFQPERIMIASRPTAGQGWSLELDAGLAVVSWSDACALDRGTEVRLERAAAGDEIASAVWQAAHDEARFLTRRDRPNRPVLLWVNGRQCHAELDLPAPSVRFHRRGLRGVVALASEPRVELFAHGLRVRTATTLDELTRRDRRPPRLPAMPDGLWPQVILDSSRLEVLLSRGDAREGRVLDAALRVARRELDALVRRQLDRAAPLGLRGRFAEALARLRSWFGSVRTTGFLVAAAAAAAGGLAVVFGPTMLPGFGGRYGASTSAAVSTAPNHYRDLEASYRRPGVAPIGDGGPSWALSYSPAAATPFFAGLIVSGMDADGRVLLAPPAGDDSLLADASAAGDSLSIELEIDAAPGVVRVPVPTGQCLIPGSLQLAASPHAVVTVAGGVPALRFTTARQVRVDYRTASCRPQRVEVDESWPALPGQLAERAADIGRQAYETRIHSAAETVAELVPYDRSPATIAAYRAMEGTGLSFLERALAIGAGDCDVQSVVLAALLSEVGVPARMAVGAVGADGRAASGLHAWVEALDGSGRWRVEEVPSPVTASRAARGRGAEPTPAAFVADRDEGTNRMRTTASIAGVLVVGLLIVVLVARRSVSHRFRTLPGDQRLALVRGALGDAIDLRSVASLLTRPLVPMVRGPARSLDSVRRLARGGRLFVAHDLTHTALRAAAAGCAVVDGSEPVGETVAELIGAHDLDWWARMLTASTCTDATRRVEVALKAWGAPWTLRMVDSLERGEVAAIDLGFLKVALMDASSPRWHEVEVVARERPVMAALAVAELLDGRISVDRGALRQVRLELAREALSELTGAAGASA